MEYLDTIRKLLKPNGRWINYGMGVIIDKFIWIELILLLLLLLLLMCIHYRSIALSLGGCSRRTINRIESG
jgi:hypothetical protein